MPATIPERFNYSVDTVLTEEYRSALHDLENVVDGSLTEPYEKVDLDINTSSVVVALRTIILAAGRFTETAEEDPSYLIQKMKGSAFVLLEALGYDSFQRDRFPMIRLFFNPDVKINEDQIRRVDLWLPDSDDTQFIWRVHATERIGTQRQDFYPGYLDTEKGQSDMKSFMALWKEGLTYLLKTIPQPSANLPEPMENAL